MSAHSPDGRASVIGTIPAQAAKRIQWYIFSILPLIVRQGMYCEKRYNTLFPYV
jgi:hypothetical protein